MSVVHRCLPRGFVEVPTFQPNSSCAEARWSSLEPRRDLVRSGIRGEYLLRLREAYVARSAACSGHNGWWLGDGASLLC